MFTIKRDNIIFLLVILGLLSISFQNRQFDLLNDASEVNISQEERESEKKEGDIFHRLFAKEVLSFLKPSFRAEVVLLGKSNYSLEVPSPPPNA